MILNEKQELFRKNVLSNVGRILDGTNGKLLSSATTADSVRPNEDSNVNPRDESPAFGIPHQSTGPFYPSSGRRFHELIQEILNIENLSFGISYIGGPERVNLELKDIFGLESAPQSFIPCPADPGSPRLFSKLVGRISPWIQGDSPSSNFTDSFRQSDIQFPAYSDGLLELLGESMLEEIRFASDFGFHGVIAEAKSYSSPLTKNLIDFLNSQEYQQLDVKIWIVYPLMFCDPESTDTIQDWYKLRSNVWHSWQLRVCLKIDWDSANRASNTLLKQWLAEPIAALWLASDMFTGDSDSFITEMTSMRESNFSRFLHVLFNRSPGCRLILDSDCAYQESEEAVKDMEASVRSLMNPHQNEDDVTDQQKNLKEDMDEGIEDNRISKEASRRPEDFFASSGMDKAYDVEVPWMDADTGDSDDESESFFFDAEENSEGFVTFGDKFLANTDLGVATASRSTYQEDLKRFRRVSCGDKQRSMVNLTTQNAGDIAFGISAAGRSKTPSPGKLIKKAEVSYSRKELLSSVKKLRKSKAGSVELLNAFSQNENRRDLFQNGMDDLDRDSPADEQEVKDSGTEDVTPVESSGGRSPVSTEQSPSREAIKETSSAPDLATEMEQLFRGQQEKENERFGTVIDRSLPNTYAVAVKNLSEQCFRLPVETRLSLRRKEVNSLILPSSESRNQAGRVLNELDRRHGDYRHFGEAFHQAILFFEHVQKRPQRGFELYKRCDNLKILVLGAGTGAIVDRLMEVVWKNFRSHTFAFSVVEPRESCIPVLLERKKNVWSKIVDQILVFRCEIEKFVPTSTVDVVVWDLLGDYGQTEIIPHSLGQVHKYLKCDSILIPEVYSTLIAPVCAPKLTEILSQTGDEDLLEKPWITTSSAGSVFPLAEPRRFCRIRSPYFVHPEEKSWWPAPYTKAVCTPTKSNSAHQYVTWEQNIPGNDEFAVFSRRFQWTAGCTGVLSGLLFYLEVQLLVNGSRLSSFPGQVETKYSKSYFSTFLPLKAPVIVNKGDTIDLYLARNRIRDVESRNEICWYEWGNCNSEKNFIYNEGGKVHSLRISSGKTEENLPNEDE